MKIENIGNFEEKSYTECPLYKKMTEGRYPWGSDEDKVLKYCANDVTIIAEQMAKEKQKELEDKVEKYEKILVDIYNILHPYCAKNESLIAEEAFRRLPNAVKAKVELCDRTFKSKVELEAKTDKYEEILIDICDALDPHFDFDKYDDDMEAFENFPSRILDLKRSCKDNFDECIRKMDIIDELKAENAKLKEEIKRIDAQRDRMLSRSVNDDKRWNDLNNKFCLPLCIKLYGTTKVNKTYDDILSDISDLKDRADGNYKASIRKDELIKSLRHEKKDKDDEIMKLRFALGEKTEDLHKLSDNYDELLDKHENLAKKNRELQIRVNDLLFQEMLNKSAFGYDYEEENGKLRVENERLRNENEHIHEQAKKWKNKYKEAYDILQEFFGEHSNIRSVGYDLSGDYLTLKLSYDDSAYTKHNRLEKARERMRKLD